MKVIWERDEEHSKLIRIRSELLAKDMVTIDKYTTVVPATNGHTLWQPAEITWERSPEKVTAVMAVEFNECMTEAVRLAEVLDERYIPNKPKDDEDFLMTLGLTPEAAPGCWRDRSPRRGVSVVKQVRLNLGQNIIPGTPEKGDEFLANCIAIFGPWLRQNELELEITTKATELATARVFRRHEEDGYDCIGESNNQWAHQACLDALLLAIRQVDIEKETDGANA